MAGIFGEFFLVSISHETKHEKSSKNSGKIRSKIRGKIRDENSNNSGNFRETPSLMSQGKNATTQFLSLDCLAVTLTVGVILKEEKFPLLWARDSLGGISGDTLGEGNCESKMGD